MTDIQQPNQTPVERSPFGGQTSSARTRVARAALYAGSLLATLAAVYFVTREPARGAPSEGETHAHAAGDVTADSAMIVTLPRQEAERIGVTYSEATIGTLHKEVRTVGQVTYDETRVKAISLKVDGWVERLFVNYSGQPIRRGEPLLAIYSPMLVTAQEELLLANRLRREVSLGTADAARSADDLLVSARRRLLYWDVPPDEVERVERTGEVRRTLTLVSPVSGFVVEKTVLAGQRVMAGDPLYRVADLRLVWVEGEVFEQDLAAVQAGQTVAAEFEAFPGERWTGRISYVYPTLTPETRTARVRVEISNADLRLKPGMYATLLVRGSGRANALSVPRSAVLATGERYLVFVKRTDGKLEPRPVTIGMSTSDRVEVREGLTAGDTVVASATFLVDAESNLGSALGGMGNMPGMDIADPAESGDRPPAAVPVRPGAPATPRAKPTPPAATHDGHRE
jgi:Cu(I)/Ag(I) efflux system membrane fusion protein